MSMFEDDAADGLVEALDDREKARREFLDAKEVGDTEAMREAKAAYWDAERRIEMGRPYYMKYAQTD